MELTSTQFVSFQDIKTGDTDIYGDAWGFDTEFSDVLSLLGKIDSSRADDLGEKLIGLIHTGKE